MLAPPELEEHMRALLFRESTTLGVRERQEKRYALPRHHEEVTTPWGEVRMKIASLNGTPRSTRPSMKIAGASPRASPSAEDGDAGSHSLVSGQSMDNEKSREVLHHHAHLLRQCAAPHRAHVHHGGVRCHCPAPAHDGRGHVLPHRHRRARAEDRALGGRRRLLAQGVRRQSFRRVPRRCGTG